jgi:hypothetical protein
LYGIAVFVALGQRIRGVAGVAREDAPVAEAQKCRSRDPWLADAVHW